jgi:hypothetical protein
LKIVKSHDTINSFGGLNFISDEFDKLKLPEVITNHFGLRSRLATYEYHDIVKNLWMIYFAGGDCAEDIQTNLKVELSNIENMKLCSADTILRLQKMLNTEKEIHLSKANVVNEFNNNDKLNKLNLALLLQTRQLVSGKEYDFDFDNQFIACEKYDAKKGYKMKRGYFPGVATIGKNIIYLENRNGNSNVKFKQEDTLETIYKLLKESDIKVHRSRMDCGSFTQDVVKTVEENSTYFFIRAQRCKSLSTQIRAVSEWKKIMIGSKEVEIASVQYKPFGEEKEYRYVVSREPNNTGQIDVFHESHFIYRAIMTNHWEMKDEEVIHFYNQRGASEKIFDEMNNDFGWGNLPFSFLEENTVYMSLMAMCRNFYLHVVEKFAKKIDFVENTFRLKKFIFRFIIVPFKWVKIGGQKALKLFTDKPYQLVLE